MLELAEECVALEGVAVPLEDRVGRQEGAVEGVVVLRNESTAVTHEKVGKQSKAIVDRCVSVLSLVVVAVVVAGVLAQSRAVVRSYG